MDAFKSRIGLSKLNIMKMKVTVPGIGKYFFAAFVFFACAACMVSCTEDDDDAGGMSDEAGYVGDPFDDVPGAYVLTEDTWPSSALPGKGTEEYPYRIRNASDLLCFVNMSNSGVPATDENIRYSMHIRLEHDIEVDEGFSWVPIGIKYDSSKMFYGVFDGAGHKITGTLDTEFVLDGSLVYGGFFGASALTVKNLTIDADIVVGYSITDGRQGGSLCFCVGGVAAFLAQSSYGGMSNCRFTGSINVENEIQAGAYAVGGLIGMGDMRQDAMDCVSDGALNIKTLAAENVMVGGICGWSRGEGSTSHGGFTGIVNRTPIMIGDYRCDRLYVGGIYGAAFDDVDNAARNDRIVGCENYGPIDIVGGSTLYLGKPGAEPDAYTYVGGIVGYAARPDCFESNTNYAGITVKDVESNTFVGGLCGHVGGLSKSCVNEGSVTNASGYGRATGGCFGVSSSDVFDCRNLGAVYGTGYTGGIVGEAVKDGVHGCLNSADVDGTNAVGFEEQGRDYAVGGIAGAALSSAVVYSCCVNEGSVQGAEPLADTYYLYVGMGNVDVEPCGGDHSQWE